MFCKKCGTEITDEMQQCPNCGFEILLTEATTETDPNSTDSSEVTTAANLKLSVWCWSSIISFICGCFTFYKGIDKLVRYNSGEYYPFEAANAYVGGDAYNYIINGTHATAFFVLTAMFILAAVGLLIVHYISKEKK